MASPWYKNRRGEWYVIGQFALCALIALGPRTMTGLPAWSRTWCMLGAVAGVVLMGAGACLALAGVLKHGRSLTPFICPKGGSVLLEQGVYRLVRHPIYSGLLQMAVGWGLWVHGWLTLGYALLLFALLDVKARREEVWLVERFPGYTVYRRRVRRFIPHIY